MLLTHRQATNDRAIVIVFYVITRTLRGVRSGCGGTSRPSPAPGLCPWPPAACPAPSNFRYGQRPQPPGGTGGAARARRRRAAGAAGLSVLAGPRLQATEGHFPSERRPADGHGCLLTASRPAGSCEATLPPPLPPPTVGTSQPPYPSAPRTPWGLQSLLTARAAAAAGSRPAGAPSAAPAVEPPCSCPALADSQSIASHGFNGSAKVREARGGGGDPERLLVSISRRRWRALRVKRSDRWC